MTTSELEELATQLTTKREKPEGKQEACGGWKYDPDRHCGICSVKPHNECGASDTGADICTMECTDREVEKLLACLEISLLILESGWLILNFVPPVRWISFFIFHFSTWASVFLCFPILFTRALEGFYYFTSCSPWLRGRGRLRGFSFVHHGVRTLSLTTIERLGASNIRALP